MDVVRHRLGIRRVKFNGSEVLQEIGREIDILSLVGNDIVVSHVIVPADLRAYREMLRSRKLTYTFVVLAPQYSAALARSRARTSFGSVTPEAVIKQFHDEMRALQGQDDVIVFDNSDYRAEESAETVLRAVREHTPVLGGAGGHLSAGAAGRLV